MNCTLCNVTMEGWWQLSCAPDLEDDDPLCERCWDCAVAQYGIDHLLDRYGYNHASETLTDRLLQTVIGIRQVLGGIMNTSCAEQFNLGEKFWCDPEKGKHSCYCPVYTLGQIMELTKWVDR